MAIIGRIEDLIKQTNLQEGIERGLSFLRETNLVEIFTSIQNGADNVIKIDGEKLFAVFSSYPTKENTPPVFEAHRKYIDVQYIIKGEEQIFVTSEGITNKGEYNGDNDCQFAESKTFSSFLLTPGTAAILFPEDWHAPGQQSSKPEEVQKIVVKVAVFEKAGV